MGSSATELIAFSVSAASSRYTSLVPSCRRATALVYFSLLANVILFFHKPLFSTAYLFPWDFRSVQLPLLSFLVDRLRAGHFALWNPYSYCGYPVFANIEACYFQPFVLAAPGSRRTRIPSGCRSCSNGWWRCTSSLRASRRIICSSISAPRASPPGRAR